MSEIVLRGQRRPDRALMIYYALNALATGPLLLGFLPYYFFRFRTLRYDFDEEGVTVRWGILFRREITLTYARIQDIHLVSNLVERWLGLGRVQIQTAAGSSQAEMQIEGLPDFEQVRDELYARMRGVRGEAAAASGPGKAEGASEVVAALNAAVEELRLLRQELARKP